jgi:hypothetical protein
MASAKNIQFQKANVLRLDIFSQKVYRRLVLKHLSLPFSSRHNPGILETAMKESPWKALKVKPSEESCALLEVFFAT